MSEKEQQLLLGRTITMKSNREKNSGKSTKTDTKNEAKSLRATNFCYLKVGRDITLWGEREKSQILLVQYWKRKQFDKAPKMI